MQPREGRATATLPLERGERAPDFVLPREDGTPTRFYARAGGRPAVLIFYDAEAEDEPMRLIRALEDCASGAFSLFVVRGQRAGSNQPASPGREGRFPVFSDTQGAVRAAYRLATDAWPALFVLDPNLRVLASLTVRDARSTAQSVLAILDEALPRVDPVEIAAQAPVLMIPNVLDQEACRQLISVWETQGSVETGVEQSREARREDVLRPDTKRRRDHTVTDAQLLRRLASMVGRRVMPEVLKAFGFKATRFEGFKIACYDAAAGGFFHSHRDNLSPATAHRRFALSVNLNEGYEGGCLVFPEYGPHLYRPAAGGALVFSCAHLHEVTQMRSGRRFALLSFLFGEADVPASRAQPQDGPPRPRSSR